MLELLILGTSFVLVSGLFAMIDAAILSVNHAEVEVLIAKKRWGARSLRRLLRHSTRAIIVIVIFTNMTNILGPILVGLKSEALFGSHVIGIVTAVLTLLTIVFSEIIPKSIGSHHAPRIARLSAPFLRIATILLYPLVIVLERISLPFRSGKRKVGTEGQIRALANLGSGEGHIDADEREFIHRAFVLNDRTAGDIMTPASSMVCIAKNQSLRQAAKIIFDNSYSRYPVTGESLDDILGYMLSSDVLELLADGRDNLPITGIIRNVHFVDSALRCDELLNVMRKKDLHLAMVRSGGKTVGLVTLEDVLEELVGEIRDEGDTEA
ncbi:MAG: hemolysin family protein [Candidatus Peribacteraceae bacterium]|nr:hemolysin family protein [Candidatus Peribacteraceae bacterium]